MPKQILILDSTQIDAYLTCPQLWQYGQKERLTPMGGPSTGEAMAMGTYGHKLLEIYYKTVGSQIRKVCAAEAFKPDDETCLLCGKSKEEHTGDNTCTFEGKPFPLTGPSRSLVLRRFREYTYTYANKDFKPTSPEHVEVGFSHKVYEDDDFLFILEGRIDGMGSFDGHPVWWDHKFQLRSRDLYKKSIQFRNYAMATGMTMGLVNYIRLTKEVTKDTFKRDIISFYTAELRWWREELIDIYKDIAVSVGLDSFKKNYSACSGKFGYPCDFTPLCEELLPEIGKAKKEQLYTIREEWKPW